MKLDIQMAELEKLTLHAKQTIQSITVINNLGPSHGRQLPSPNNAAHLAMLYGHAGSHCTIQLFPKANKENMSRRIKFAQARVQVIVQDMNETSFSQFEDSVRRCSYILYSKSTYQLL